VNQAKRLKELKRENSWLKKLVVDTVIGGPQPCFTERVGVKRKGATGFRLDP
jgi:hypothetical protein